MKGLERGERAKVDVKDSDKDWEDVEEDDVETYEVFDHVSIIMEHYINSVNGYETYPEKVAAGDNPLNEKPEAITERVADMLWHEFGLEPETRDIEVINMDSDDVWEY